MIDQFHYLYYKNQNIYTISTQIKAIKKPLEDKTDQGIVAWISLEDTIFYAEGGGQPADRGKLIIEDQVYSVIEVQFFDDDVWHGVACALPTTIKVGIPCQGEVDAVRRVDFMQQHTSEHIISACVKKQYNLDNIGFHMDEHMAQVDFNGVLSIEAIRNIERLANEIVWANKHCYPLVLSRLEAESYDFRSKRDLPECVRLLKIEDTDLCACCGLHVPYTGQVGQIRLLESAKHRSGTRISFIAGKRALDQVQIEDKILKTLRANLSVPLEKMEDAINLIQDKQDELDKKYQQLRLDLILKTIKKDSFEKTSYLGILKSDFEIDPQLIKRVMKLGSAQYTKIFVLFIPKGSDYQFLFAGEDEIINKVTENFKTFVLNQKGQIQGSRQGVLKNIESTELESWIQKTIEINPLAL